MNLEIALAKTEKGREEIETRKYKLDHRLRALLLVVNGKSTAKELARDFDRFGDVPTMLQQLMDGGFVRSEMPFPKVRQEVASIINAALGPDSYTITLEVEKCAALPDLREYVASCRATFESALGGPRAEQLWARLNDVLG